MPDKKNPEEEQREEQPAEPIDFDIVIYEDDEEADWLKPSKSWKEKHGENADPHKRAE